MFEKDLVVKVNKDLEFEHQNNQWQNVKELTSK